MTTNFQLVPGTGLKILYGGRTVVDTAGSLVMGLPAANDYVASGVALTFPDFTKQWFYNWRWTAVCSQSAPAQYSVTENGQGFIGALPGTVTSSTILATAPAGCNFAFGLVRINRTNTPSSWLGSAIGVKPLTNVWIEAVNKGNSRVVSYSSGTNFANWTENGACVVLRL